MRDLAEEAVNDAEVPAGDAGEGGDGDALGELVGAAGQPVRVPAECEDSGELFGG